MNRVINLLKEELGFKGYLWYYDRSTVYYKKDLGDGDCIKFEVTNSYRYKYNLKLVLDNFIIRTPEQLNEVQRKFDIYKHDLDIIEELCEKLRKEGK